MNEANLFIVGDIPEALFAEDGISQSEVEHIIALGRGSNETLINGFYKQPPKTVKLTELRSDFQKNYTRTAMQRLRTRQRIHIDEELIYQKENPNLAWSALEHFLDYYLLVAARKGLDVILPTSRGDPSYVFKLDLHRRHKQWKARYADLEFNTNGRMLYIGTYGQEEVWLAMVPRTFTGDEALDDARRPTLVQPPRATSCLSEKHFSQIISFLAYQLKSQSFRDIYLREDFPADLTLDGMRNVTNLLGIAQNKAVHELRLQDVEELHSSIRDGWDEWVRNATTSDVEGWHNDYFLKDNVPITIAVRYGQNQPVCSSVQEERMEESRHWQRLHDYTNIRSISVALATHIQSVPVLRWEDIPREEIEEQHGRDIFSAPDPHSRERVNLGEHPMLDETGQENKIYDRNGCRIPRRHAIIDSPVYNGMLFNLSTLHHLFQQLDELNDEPMVPHYLYPMACLKSYGHFQAHGVMTPFATKLKALNVTLGRKFGENEGGDGIDANQGYLSKSFVEGVACQGYNMLSHRVRTRGCHHEVQLGLLTAALSGTFATTIANANIAQRFLRDCSWLPSDRFHEKITGTNIDTSTRIENVYRISLHKIPDQYRNGRTVFNEFIVPLASIWSNAELLEEIKNHLIIFRENVLPGIFEWSTYGICCLLKEIWNEFKEDTAGPEKKEVSHYVVETTATLERALNYAHTGNAKVLTRGLMDSLWVSLSLLHDGLPSISPIIVPPVHNVAKLVIRKHDWPTKSNEPLMASKKSQTINYGQDHYEGYLASFVIRHALNHLSEDYHPSLSHQARVSLFAFERAAKVYVSDVVALVVEGVRDELNEWTNAEDPILRGYAHDRKVALAAWQKQDDPLAYGSHTYAHLVRTVQSNQRNLGNGLPLSRIGQQSLRWFSEQVVESVIKSGSHIKAPFWNGGRSFPVFKYAISEAQKLFEGNLVDPNIRTKIVELITRAVSINKIFNIPWSPDHTGNVGRPIATVTHKTWINLGQIIAISSNIHDDSPLNALQRATQNALSQDANADWSCIGIRVKDLHSILNKQRLPSEWSLSKMSWPSESYVRDTYTWVQGCFDGSRPLHQVAILVGIIFSKILPDVCNDVTPFNISTSDDSTELVRRTPWVPTASDNRGGMVEPLPFIIMMSVFIIAVYDEESPLRRHMRANRGSLGNAWTKKHGAKGIKPFNLVRLGLAKSTGLGICRSAKFETHWKLLNPEELTSFHSKLVDDLKDLPYGPFRALTLLVGLDIARKLAGKSEVTERPLTKRSAEELLTNDSSPKRPRILYA